MSTLATIYQRLSESTEFPWRALLLGVIVVGGLMIGVGGETEDSWYTLYWYGAVLILTAQMSHTTRSFFMGEGPSIWDFLRYFLALDGDLKTVEKAPTLSPARYILPPHTLTPHSHPTLTSPHSHPAQPSPTLTAPHSHSVPRHPSRTRPRASKSAS